jgi:D-3-phosphoglycerate dehydrogenase
MRKGDFGYKSSHLGFDLAGKSLGIMGYGRIGRMVAKKASALDMDILIYDPFVKSSEYSQIVDRDTLLEKSDVITLHMAVTPENTEGIDQAAFAKMKDSAVLINLGRGALINQDDLITALKTHQIRGRSFGCFQ